MTDYRVWLGAGGSLTEFQARLRALDPELDAQPLQPTLQDAALRELALAEAKRPGEFSTQAD